MSNNPFLKSKESNKNKYNTRFNSLDSDDENKKSMSNNNKKQSQYDSSNNSFTKPFSSRDHNSRDRNRRDNNRMDNNRRDRDNESKLPEQNKNNHLDLNNVELFPIMNSRDIDKYVEISNSNISSTNFKDILNNVIKDDTEFIEKIKPGWVEISRSRIKGNNKNIFTYGEPTPYFKRLEKMENDLHYTMNKAIIKMSQNWYNYKEDYDELNGQGEYEEMFGLSPVYGPEYESDLDSDDDNNNDDDDNDYEYNDDIG